MELAYFRKREGLTQSALAKEAKVTQRAIANYEAGTRSPSPEIAERIACVLKMTVDEMWESLYKKSAGD